MKRPSIKSPCVADRFHGTGERIAEVLFPSGRGCLIKLITIDGVDHIEIYRADAGIVIGAFDNNGTRITRGKTK